MLKESSLLSALDRSDMLADLQTCTVQPYAHIEPWAQSYVRIGEAAFSLDPLSSTGVEKAMRFALQSVVAIHTCLKLHKINEAREFYEEKLKESVLTHTQWTRMFYNNAWLPKEGSFWGKRAKFYLEYPETESVFATKLLKGLTEDQKITAPSPENNHDLNLDAVLWKLRYNIVAISPNISYKDSYCVENDLVVVKKALVHKGLARELVYVDEIEIKPLLDLIQPDQIFEDLLKLWAEYGSLKRMRRLMVFLWSEKILLAK
jgi:hypothetical protein